MRPIMHADGRRRDEHLQPVLERQERFSAEEFELNVGCRPVLPQPLIDDLP
jgi:hypothetical protein